MSFGGGAKEGSTSGLERAHPAMSGPPHDRWGPAMGMSGPIPTEGGEAAPPPPGSAASTASASGGAARTPRRVQLNLRYAAATGTPKHWCATAPSCLAPNMSTR